MHKKKILAGLLCALLAFSSADSAFAEALAEGNVSLEEQTTEGQNTQTGSDTADSNTDTSSENSEKAEDTGKTDQGESQSKADQSQTSAENKTSAVDSSTADKTESSKNSDNTNSSESREAEAAEENKSAISEAAEEEEKALEEGSYEAWKKAIEESTKTNEELLAEQNISHVESHAEDFRFYQVKEQYAFAKESLSVYSACSEDADVVGSLEEGGLCYILQEKGDWLYIESGNVRGYILSASLVGEKTADYIYEALKEKAAEENTDVRELAELAEESCPWYENAAYADYKGTTENPVIEKKYALVTADAANIYEETRTDSRKVGSLKKDSLAYVIQEIDQDWLYVESADVRGFVSKADLDDSQQVQDEVTEKGEDSYELADELVESSENKALYYSKSSIQEGSPYLSIRQELLDYAKQFLGTPYIFGGTSLTEGCDCSGFAMGIYGHFGYSLPRSSAYQSAAGTQIPVSEAQPGDLIFYATNGIVHHVVIYQGEGRTVEAKGTGYGVCESTVESNAVWAVSILQDELDENYIGQAE